MESHLFYPILESTMDEYTSVTVASREGWQVSGGRSKVGSNFPRKIGTGMLYILGFLERGYQKVGVPIFLCHRPFFYTMQEN